MTSGVKVTDLRTGVAPYWYGRYFSKTWNGADRIPSPPNPLEIKRVSRTRYRIRVKRERILSLVSKERTYFKIIWVPENKMVSVRRRSKISGRSYNVDINRKVYVPRRVKLTIPGSRYYKILPEVITVIPRTKIKILRERRLPPRSSWGEHGYSVVIGNVRQSLQEVQTWTNWPSLPATWTSSQETCTSWIGNPFYQDFWSSNDDLALIGRLRQNILGSQFHAGKFLIEGHEALKTIANIAERIAHSYLFAKRGNWKAAFRSIAEARTMRSPSKGLRTAGSGSLTIKALPSTDTVSVKKTASNNWLQWSYGVKPLLSDVKEAAEALAQQLNFSHVKGVSTASLTRPGRAEAPSPVFDYHEAYAFTRARIKAVYTEIDLPQLSGLTDVASAVWERTPWSFVADWFIPIGNFLEARGAAQALTAVYVTTKKVHHYANGGKYKESQAKYKIENGQFDFEKLDIQLDRTVSTTLPVPNPSFVPLEKVPSWQRAANAVSLLVQKLAR